MQPSCLLGLLVLNPIFSELTIAGISANNGTISDDGAAITASTLMPINGEVTLNYVVAAPIRVLAA